MRGKINILLLLAWPVLLPAQFESQRDWKEYTFIDAGFRLRSPAPLTERVDTVETDIGSLAFHTLYWQQPDEETGDNLFYQVNWVQYPTGLFPPDSSGLIEDLFQSTMEEAAATVKGELIYSTPISLQGYPGYLWRIHYLGEKAVIKTRAYLRKDRYIEIKTVTFRDRSLNESTDRFLESLRFLE